MRTIDALVITVSLAFVGTACGDDETSSASGGGGSTTTTTSTTGDGGSTADGTSSSTTSGDGGAGGAGGEGGGTPATFPERRAYAHLVEPFETEEECIAAQDPEFFINCYQVVELCTDGSAYLMLTDIIDRGTYVRGDGAIETTWEGASGAPPSVTFTVTSETTLVDDAYDLEWTLDEEGIHALGCP